MGWNAGTLEAQTNKRYEIVISRFNPQETPFGIIFKNNGDLSVKSFEEADYYGAAKTVASLTLNNDLTIEKIGTYNTKYFQTTRTALNNGEPLPELNSPFWTVPSSTQSRCDHALTVFFSSVQNRFCCPTKLMRHDASVDIATILQNKEQQLQLN